MEIGLRTRCHENCWISCYLESNDNVSYRGVKLDPFNVTLCIRAPYLANPAPAEGTASPGQHLTMLSHQHAQHSADCRIRYEVLYFWLLMISNNVRFKSQGDYGIKPPKCLVVRGPVESDSDMHYDLLWLYEAQQPMGGGGSLSIMYCTRKLYYIKGRTSLCVSVRGH